MIRNDPEPREKPGYEPTGEGRYAQCPDHGSRLWWHEERQVFYCPALVGWQSAHADEPYEIAPQNVYLEHDEAWRVVNGCLWVDTYDEIPEEDS